MTLPQGKFWTYLAIAEVVGGIIIAIIAVPSYLANKQAQAELSATLKAQEAVISRLDASIKERDAQAAETVKQMRELAAAVKSPAQAVAAFPKVIELPKPIFMQAPEPSGPPSGTPDKLPDAPSAVIPAESVVPLYQRLATCQQNEILLGTCQQNNKDLQAKAESLEMQRDAAVKAARGGFWHRFVGCAMRGLVGAAGGGIAGNKNAAIGGFGIGVGSCFLVKP